MAERVCGNNGEDSSDFNDSSDSKSECDLAKRGLSVWVALTAACPDHGTIAV